MLININSIKVIDVHDFDGLVRDTYGKPYNFQQQDGCKNRQMVNITVPCYAEDYENDTVPEEVNHPQMGVSFQAWLNRDPMQGLNGEESAGWDVEMWWERNFYPDVSMILNDLHDKGLLPEGKYSINIDW